MKTSPLAAGCLALASATAVPAGTVEISLDEPSLDRWMYPFNPTPGSRPSASTFGSFEEPDFDNRDAQMIVGFDTSDAVEPGLGPDSYQLLSVRLILQVERDETFIYDDTYDPFNVFLDPSDEEYFPDEDPGTPIEVYGTGFRNGFDLMSFLEDSPYSPFGPFGQGIRSAYAFDFDDAGEAIDVSLNVAERFDPDPWAIGVIPDVDPGELVPLDSQVIFDLDVDDSDIQGYLQAALDAGVLDLTVSSLHPVGVMKGSFPSFYTKENALVKFGLASAARLEMEVLVQQLGDLDDDGVVGFSDLLILLSAWGACPPPPAECAEDLDRDGAVGFADLLILLSNWG